LVAPSTGYKSPLPNYTNVAQPTGPVNISGYNVESIVQVPNQDGIFVINTDDPSVSSKTWLVLPQPGGESEIQDAVLFERNLYRLSGADYQTYKRALGITDSSVVPNKDFVDKALKEAKKLSSENYFKSWNKQQTVSFQDKLFNPAYKTTTAGGTSKSVSLTAPEVAVAEYKDLVKQYLGEEVYATLNPKVIDADAKAYQKQKNKLERNRPTTTRSGDGYSETIAGGLNEDEAEQIALDLIGKYVTVEGLKNAGGAIGNNLRQIKASASDYGLSLSPADLRQYALNSISQKDGLQNTLTKFNNLARVKYAALTPYLDQGLSVRDIANEYISKKANLLELNPAGITLDDSDVQSALTGSALTPLYQFETQLRKNPKWQYTNNARELASSYAITTLQDFGLI
jgi:hypothetical protein